MSRRAQENLIALALLVVFAGVIWLSLDFGRRARMIPLPLAVFGIVLTLVQIVWQNLRSVDELQMNLIDVAAPEAARDAAVRSDTTVPDAERRAEPSWLRELRAFGMIGLLLALILVTGLLPGVFVFTAAYFIMTRQYSVTLSIMYTAAFTALVYLLFFAALQIEPYYGLLTPLIESLR